MSQIDACLMILGNVGHLLLAIVLWQRKSYRAFPIFFAYMLYSLFSDIAYLAWFQHMSKDAYFRLYFADNVPEFSFQLGILFEVARNVLSPVKRSLPKSSLAVFAGIAVSGTVLACLLSIHSQPAQLTRWSQYFVQINFTVAIVRLVIFSAIVLFSQMLGIGWKNHVLPIATGFAGYSIVALVVEMLHRFTGVTDNSVYHLQEQLRMVAWCIALGYWNYALARREAPRREFGPKMADFLISISGRVREERAVVVRVYQK